MTDRPDADDADLTRRHDLPGAAEGAATTPSTSDATATPPIATPTTPTSASTGSYTPQPTWTRHADPAAVPATPERWYEPAAAAATAPVQPATTGAPRSRATGTVIAAAALSAILASGGTVFALGAAGALTPAAPVPTSAVGTNVSSSQPVTIDESSATIAVAAKVNPAVVRITVNANVDTNQGVIPETGVGSGVIYDSNGWILTNRHVVEGSNQLQVELLDGRILEGQVYGIDTLTDLAIVKVDATDLPTAAIGDSDALKIGQLVIAIGSPLGTYSNSVTSGIVSAKGRTIQTDSNQNLNNLIQTDAAINPGNSGGPLLDANGSVIGINTAIARDSNGIGFAIPIDIARPIMAQAVAGKELARPFMGVNYRAITRQLAEAENLPVTNGAVIGGGQDGGPGVQSGTPAAEAGLKEGDIIVKVDGQAIDAEHPLDATLSQHAPGDTVTVEVLRGDQTLNLELTLGTRPANF